MRTVGQQAIMHQQWAARHAFMADVALERNQRSMAIAHQELAADHYRQARLLVLALLLQEPIL